MAYIYEFEYTIHSVIDNLDERGMPEGEPEISISSTEGFLKDDGERLYISFAEMTEGGRVLSDLTLDDGAVSLKKRGAVEFDVVFREGDRIKTVYSVVPYSFDAVITTKKIRSDISKTGGTLRLHYSMNIGGQDKAVRLKISARPKARA